MGATNKKDLSLFEILKQKVVTKLRKSHPEVSDDISQWKGSDITLFQDDLLEKVNGRISEKWFYTHMKNTHSTLPRVDVLDMLSVYVGYKSWRDFAYAKAMRTQGAELGSKTVLVIVAFLTLMTCFFWIREQNAEEFYEFCFVDALSKKPLSEPIEVVLLNDGQSPLAMEEEGHCFTVSKSDKEVKFVVQAPYYQPDTIIRIFDKDLVSETIDLRADDHSLALHYFSQSKVKDWQSRRKFLDELFMDEVKIYQIDESQRGRALYNKWEFIDKLTMPISNLRDIEILETVYEGEQIKVMRFKVDKP